MVAFSVRRRWMCVCCAVVWTFAGVLRGEGVPALMPMPAHVEPRTGQMLIDGSFDTTTEGYSEPRLARARVRFLARMVQQTGVPMVSSAPGNHARLVIRVAGPSKPVQELGEDEAYQLDIAPGQAVLTAANPLGALHGLQTFLQLVTPTPQGFAVPAMRVADQPRFPWRGLMLDTGRHFMPLAQVLQTIDGMEAVKMNVFHWHLSEDQGFRVESTQFPLLQEKGSDGLFYTQDEIRGTVAYARDRGIRVIPEFDMPGHTTAWFVGYPELASAPGPYQIERRWGVFDPAMDPSREQTYTFLDRFLGEMTTLFPDAYFHVGGDECNGKQWDGNARIQEFKRAHGLKDNAALQAYFTARVQELVTKHGKQMVGWDEVLQPDTPHNVLIQSWRGSESLAEAARRGYRGILSAGYYIDLNQPASEHYLADPFDAKEGNHAEPLTPEQAKNILGGETTMWSEFISPEILANRVWPRTAAIAERLWSPRAMRDVSSMYARLPAISHELGYLGLRNGSVRVDMLERMSGQSDVRALEVLAEAVQPPRDYVRGSLKTYDQFTPLNRMVDAVPAESDVAREFTAMAQRIHDGAATAAERAEVRRRLLLWQGNDAVLAPELAGSDAVAELAPVSQQLARTAAIGLAAMDRLEQRHGAPDPQTQQVLAELKSMAGPGEAALRNMVVPGVVLLVETR